MRHGRYIAVGDTQGRVSVLKSDTLDEVKSFVLEDSTASITALTWSSYLAKGEVRQAFDPLNFDFHLHKLDSLNPNMTQAAKDTLALLRDSGNPASVLVASDANGTI